jgi:hypothetical protein
MKKHFKCFNVKILDCYNATVHSLLCNKLSESKMRVATITIILVYFGNEITRLRNDIRKITPFLDQTAQKGNATQTSFGTNF